MAPTIIDMADIETSRAPSAAEPNAPSQMAVVDPVLLKDISGELKLQELLDQHRSVHTDDARAKAWSDVATKAQTFGDDMVSRWNREIDTYLLFAGLFSAILTAFNVQSYQLLQPGGPNPTVQALERISLQLHSFSISYPFVNSTQPGGPVLRDVQSGTPVVARSAVWLNILWFSGLILSLTSALIGIVAKQWLSEYSAVSGSSRDKARTRQYRAANLVKWHVGDIILLIPVLLVLSLAFFLAGLLVLLWTLHPSVAIVASVLIAIAAVFTLVVGILPVFSVSCAYLSPQSRALYSIILHTHRRVIVPIQHYLLSFPAELLFYNTNFSDRFDDIMLWLMVRFDQTDQRWSIPFGWNDRIKSAIDNVGDALDVEILVTAYESTLDPDAVSSATTCLSDLRSNAVLEYFKKLHESIVKHSRRDDKTRVTGGYPTTALLVFHVLLCAIDLSTMNMQEDLCRQVCLALSSPQHHIVRDADAKKGEIDPKKAEGTRWLQSVIAWLEPRIEVYLKPILEPSNESDGAESATSSLRTIRDHCKKLSPSKRGRQEGGRELSASVVNVDQAFGLLCRQLDRCQRFVHEQLDMVREAMGPTKASTDVSPAQLKYLRVVLAFLRMLPGALTTGDDQQTRIARLEATREVLSQLFAILARYRECLGAPRLEDVVLSSCSKTSDYLTLITDIVDSLQHDDILPFVSADVPIYIFDRIIVFLWNLPSMDGSVSILDHESSLERLTAVQEKVNALQTRVRTQLNDRHSISSGRASSSDSDSSDDFIPRALAAFPGRLKERVTAAFRANTLDHKEAASLNAPGGPMAVVVPSSGDAHDPALNPLTTSTEEASNGVDRQAASNHNAAPDLPVPHFKDKVEIAPDPSKITDTTEDLAKAATTSTAEDATASRHPLEARFIVPLTADETASITGAIFGTATPGPEGNTNAAPVTHNADIPFQSSGDNVMAISTADVETAASHPSQTPIVEPPHAVEATASATAWDATPDTNPTPVNHAVGPSPHIPISGSASYSSVTDSQQK
ncbi:hypothetical protein C2E23DRAFT_890292 [Lenzites betulinus]|nr:hypothetical protein C2E23DRAFT_890292 [Lenzites betulinus]